MAVVARTQEAQGFGLAALFAKVRVTLAAWGERLDARRELAELTPREIADIGLDPIELEREIAKPFWRA